jgi:hypothetical protein
MGVKGVSPIEQHCEKAVVGVVGLAFVGVLAMQFTTSPNMVKVGSQTVPPDQVLKPIEQQAQNLEAKVLAKSPTLPDIPEVNLYKRFEERLAGGVSPRPRLASLGDGISVTGTVAPARGDEAFAAVRAPAPASVVAGAIWTTIDPYEVIKHPEIRTVLPKDQPYDMPVVTVQATFSGVGLRDVLDKDPDGDGPLQAVRRQWWQNAIEIARVELERETQDPITGAWGDTTIVSSMPGRPDHLPEFMNSVQSPGDVGPALDVLRMSQTEILRPPFYGTMAGTPTWTEPGERVKGGEAEDSKLPREVNTLVARGRDTQRRLETLERNLQNLQNQPGREPPTRDGGGGGRGGGRGSPGNESGTRGAGERKSPEEARREQMQKQIDDAVKQLEKIDADLAKLGFNPEGKPLDASGANASRQTAGAGASGGGDIMGDVLSAQAIKIWAHDVAAQPGATYRYRTRVVINNPYFGQESYLKQDQQELAQNQIAAGEWSQWTAPVAVDGREHFFVSNASPADALRGARATVEIFKFYYGYPRREVMTVEPGDVITGEVRIPEGLRIFDEKKLQEGLPIGEPRMPPDAPAVAPGRRGTPGQPLDESGGRGRPISPNRDRDPEVRGRDREVTPPQDVDGAPLIDEEALAAISTPAPRVIPVGVNAVMLDVATNAVASGDGSGGTPTLVYLRDETGRIVRRNPVAERTADVYKRLVEASKAGEAQGKPKPTVEEKRDVPPPPPPPPTRRPGSGGGGGGGGGGG